MSDGDGEAFYAYALTSAGIGVWELDIVDGAVRRSPEHDRIFGYEPPLAHWDFDVFLAHVPAEDQAELRAAYCVALERGEAWNFEHRIIRRDGELRWLWTAGQVRLDERGRPRRLIGVVQDITERKLAERDLREAEAALREAARRKDEYLAMLGHELRNPLGAIRTATQLLTQGALDPDRLLRACAVLDRQSLHMSRIIDGLLDVSRIARGKIALELRRLDLRALVEGVVEVQALAIAQRGLRLITESTDAPVWITGDEARLVQVFDNLIGNAIKFTAPPGTIRVAVERERERVRVRIRDTGVGIRSELLESIFEPFHQEDQDAARSAGGLGLGLALARGLVELHDGTLTAHSGGPGAGAEFVLSLPCAAAPTEPRAPGPEPAAVGRRILVVEDNADAAAMLAELLGMRGHEVVVAATGSEALERLHRRAVDLVLCDLGLPGMSGYELAGAIRSDPALRDTPLVALTGYGQPEDRRRSTAAGFDAHLTKPAKLQEIDAALARLTR